jgi:tetratricopeptide (TPR) repeat protein
MEREDENDELNDLIEEVKRYENMLKTGNKQWFDSDEFLDIADYYEGNGKIKEAVKVIKLAYKTFPTNDEVTIRLSQIYSNKKMFPKAESILKEYLKKDSHNNDIYAALACLYIENNYNEKGIKILKNVIEKIGKDNYEDNFVNYLFIGKAYTNEKKWIVAEKYIQTALRINNDIDALELYVLCASDKRLKKRMVNFMTTLIKSKPYDDNVWMTYGIIQYRFNDYNEAINAFDYAIAINTNEYFRHLYKGLTLKDLDRKEEAIEELFLANKYNQENITPLIEIGNLYMDEREYKKAIDIYKDLLEKGEDYEKQDYYFNISLCYFSLGKKALGEKYEKLALDECYDFSLMTNFAKELYLNGFKDESENIFQDLLLNEDDDVVVEATVTLAYLYKNDGNLLQAIQIVKDSINNISSSQITLYYCLLDLSSCEEKLYKYSTKLLLDILVNFSVSAKTIIKRCPNIHKNTKLINYIKDIINENK